MDDFVVANLNEGKNEWCARLVNILTPLVIEGIRSIFDEAIALCKDNDEDEKYLMTFQNLLSRIPKWNPNIIETEKNRIIKKSNCEYLEDLITCVHIIQLKVLTCIRVGQKQKKIDIDIPKLNDFLHLVYIHTARKVYTNVYLFELDTKPLQVQKYNRELEVMVKECIMLSIRESIPIEQILQAYMDETVEEEIIEEKKDIVETNVDASGNKLDTPSETVLSHEESVVPRDFDKPVLVEKVEENSSSATESTSSADTSPSNSVNSVEDNTINNKKSIADLVEDIVPVNNSTVTEHADTSTKDNSTETKNLLDSDKSSLTNTTAVVDINAALDNKAEEINDTKQDNNVINTNKNSNISLQFSGEDRAISTENKEEIIQAPKTIDRLEEISNIRNEQRKLEEEEDESDTIKIHTDNNVDLGLLDVHDIEHKVELTPDPILSDIEVLG